MRTTIIENQNKWKDFFENAEKVMTENKWTQKKMFTEIVKGMPNKVGKSTLEGKYTAYKSNKTDATLLHDKFKIGKTDIDELNICLKREYSYILNSENHSDPKFEIILKEIQKLIVEKSFDLDIIDLYRELLNHVKNEAQEKEIEDLSEKIIKEFNDNLKLEELKIEGFEYFYLYYYQGSKESEGMIKPALICFKKVREEWGAGKLYYLQKSIDGNGYMYNSTFILERLESHEGFEKNPKFIYYKAISENDKYIDQVNLFTFNIFNNVIAERYLLFVNILAINSTKRISSSNLGIIKKIKGHNILDEIQKKDIDSWIIAALLNRRFDFDELEQKVFKNELEFNEEKGSKNLQWKYGNRVKGNYFGVYLRNEIEPESGEKGGIVFVVMQIEEDGRVKLAYTRKNENENSDNKENETDELITCNGIFRFLNKKDSTIRCDLISSGIKRLTLYLAFKKEGKLDGIFTGFKYVGDVLFTTPIAFYKDSKIKIDEENKERANSKVKINEFLFEALIKKYDPSRIPKHKIPEFFDTVFGIKENNVFKDTPEEMLKRIKTDLNNIVKSNFETIDTCFPDE